MAEEYASKADLDRWQKDIREDLDRFTIRILERLDAVKLELIERDEIVETKLLREFRKWAVSFESKFKANEALVVGFSERMTSLEERVSELERND